jgi:type VI protein secretion system component VasA
MTLIALILAAAIVALIVTVNDGYPSTTPPPPAFTGAELEALQTAVQTLATTVAVTLDQVVVDNYAGAEWRVTLTKSDGSTIQAIVIARHNGTASADATTASCTIEYNAAAAALAELTTLDVDLSGSGAAQVLRLRATMTYASGTWKGSTWRVPQKPPQYA